MHAAEVIIAMVDLYHVAVILKLLRERVSKPREASPILKFRFRL